MWALQIVLENSGHFDIWLYSHLQKIAEKTCDLIPDAQIIQGWVNGIMSVPTKQVFGILSVLDEIHAKTVLNLKSHSGQEQLDGVVVNTPQY